MGDASPDRRVPLRHGPSARATTSSRPVRVDRGRCQEDVEGQVRSGTSPADVHSVQREEFPDLFADDAEEGEERITPMLNSCMNGAEADIGTQLTRPKVAAINAYHNLKGAIAAM